MKNLISILFVLTLVNAYWLDSDGDKTKSVLFLEYSDGTTDRLVVDKKDLLRKNVSKIVNEASKLIDKKGVSHGN
jgi:hypothetical protein